ncbi:hypothetical protein [Bacillus sp. SM2101]|uniref:MotE family protein n=1 Tax=Bacillus sp. SM2101 TaxID=2805366 RepID=UPI001BDE5E2D
MKKKKELSKFRRFLFIIVIPFALAFSIVLIIISLKGGNVFEDTKQYAAQIPFIANVVSTTGTTDPDMNENQDTIIEQKATIADLEAKIENHQAEVDDHIATIAKQEDQINELKAELNNLNVKKNDEKKDDLIVSPYENMTAKNAAAIMQKMDDGYVIDILASMEMEKRAAVLEKMEPKSAAEFTQLLAEEFNGE